MTTVEFTATNLAEAYYEDDDMTVAGTEASRPVVVVVRADGRLGRTLRGHALRSEGCTADVEDAAIIWRGPS